MSNMQKNELKTTIGINISMPAEIHRKAKINAINQRLTLKDYIIDCVRKVNDEKE